MAATFTDSQGREWELSLTFGMAKKIRKATKTDITDESKVSNLANLQRNRDSFAEALWVLVKSQADEEGIDQDAFYDSLDGQAMEDAWDAIQEAFVEFCPAGHREAIRETLAKQEEALKAVGDEIIAELNSEEFQEKTELGIKSLVKEAFLAATLEGGAK